MGKIQAENLSYTYHKNDREKRYQALRNLNFTIEEGEFVSIIGHSGCGKSTLLKVFAGLFLPTEGRVYIDGIPMQGPSTSRAVVFQEYSLFPWMTVLQNVMFGIRQARKHKKTAEAGSAKAEIRRTAVRYLEKVNMAHTVRQYPFQLSGGMRQRVAIARALAMDADILLLDEPFGALDARNRRELQDMMLRLRHDASRKKTVVFVTHDIDEAILLSDRILFMRPGEIIADLRVSQSRNLKDQLLGLFYLEGGELK